MLTLSLENAKIALTKVIDKLKAIINNEQFYQTYILSLSVSDVINHTIYILCKDHFGKTEIINS
jgi:hypothetical protein